MALSGGERTRILPNPPTRRLGLLRNHVRVEERTPRHVAARRLRAAGVPAFKHPTADLVTIWDVDLRDDWYNGFGREIETDNAEEVAPDLTAEEWSTATGINSGPAIYRALRRAGIVGRKPAPNLDGCTPC